MSSLSEIVRFLPSQVVPDVCVQKLSQQRRGYVLCTRRLTDKTYQVVAFRASSCLVLCIPKFVLARATVLGLPHTRVCRLTFARGHIFVRRYEAKVEAFRTLDTVNVRGSHRASFRLQLRDRHRRPPPDPTAVPRRSNDQSSSRFGLPYLTDVLHTGSHVPSTSLL